LILVIFLQRIPKAKKLVKSIKQCLEVFLQKKVNGGNLGKKWEAKGSLRERKE